MPAMQLPLAMVAPWPNAMPGPPPAPAAPALVLVWFAQEALPATAAQFPEASEAPFSAATPLLPELPVCVLMVGELGQAALPMTVTQLPEATELCLRT